MNMNIIQYTYVYIVLLNHQNHDYIIYRLRVYYLRVCVCVSWLLFAISSRAIETNGMVSDRQHLKI